MTHDIIGFVLAFWFAVLVVSLLYMAARDWDEFPK